MQGIPLPHPAQIKHLADNKYEVTLEPLYPGYGVTVGNALRRVLLSSMPGAAVTAVKIKFADHEFSTVPHVKEDVIQMILALKQLRIKSTSTEPVRLSLKVKGEKVVTAADITENDQVTVLNKNLHIATLDNKAAELDMEIIVEQGRGYVPVESREHEKPELGMLSIDAIYTPVRSVFFDVSNVRVGQITNFDKLVMSIETDGSLSGSEAVDIASRILVDHFAMLYTPTEVVETPEAIEEVPAPEVDTEVLASQSSLDEVQLSNRAKNALLKSGITSLEQLQALSEDQINEIPGLGEKTITEIKDLLKS